MKIKQDPETGKLLFILDNHEKMNSSPDLEVLEEYIHGLAEVVSNNIGPDVVMLTKNQDRLISICRQQQATIVALVKMVACLTDESEEELKYQLSRVSKFKEELTGEFNKLQKLISTE